MITLRNVTLRRSAKVLLDGATATINPGEKVGLVGKGRDGLLPLLDERSHLAQLIFGDAESELAIRGQGLHAAPVEFLQILRKVPKGFLPALAGSHLGLDMGEEQAKVH